MSRKITFYSFVVAAVAAMVSGLVYNITTSKLADLRAAGESVPREQIRRATNTADLWLLILFVAGVLTVILFSRFITLKRKDKT